jgi:hypothetical protein
MKKLFKTLHQFEKHKYLEPKFSYSLFELMKFLKSKYREQMVGDDGRTEISDQPSILVSTTGRVPLNSGNTFNNPKSTHEEKLLKSI